MLPLIAFLLFAFVFVSPALPPPSARRATSAPSILPAPRAVRHIPGWIPGPHSVVILKAATPNVLLLQVGNRLVALDRGVKVESVPWVKEAEGITLSYQSISARWSVLGSVSVQNGKPLAPLFVLERKVLFTRTDPKPQTYPQYETQTTLYGIDEGGHTKWQFPAKGEPPLTAISTFPDMSGFSVPEPFAPVVGGLVTVRVGKSDALTFLDAQTGAPVDTKTPEGKAALSEAIRQNGSPLLQTRGQLYRLDTGAVVYNGPLGLGSGQVQDAPLGVSADRAFWLGGGDDGWTGHSAYPTYLTTIDDKGKIAWVFPESKERDYGYGGGALDPSLEHFVLANAKQNGDAVAVVSVTRKLKNGGGTVFGLQPRTGKPIWRRTLPTLLDLVALKQTSKGVFALYRGGAKKALYLEYLNAATGKTQKVWTLPKNVNRIAATGDDLLLIDDTGLMRIYSCQTLLGK